MMTVGRITQLATDKGPLPERIAALPPVRSEPLFGIADAARVIEWARSTPRKQPSQAFTAGAERQAAYWIEWAWSNLPNAPAERRDASARTSPAGCSACESGGDHEHRCCLPHGHSGDHQCGVMQSDNDYDGDNPNDRTQCPASWPNTPPHLRAGTKEH